MQKRLLVLAILLSLLIGGGSAYAQTQRTVRFSATINPGALLADVRDNFGRSILDPVIRLGDSVNANSVQCRSSETPLSATLGSDRQRIYVDNPKAAFDGWSLTLAPVDGSAAKWRGENGYVFDHNDSQNQGCSDGDNDGVAGLMLVDPSNARIRSDCLECSTDYLSVGSDSAQSFADNRAVTLVQASENSSNVGSWYLTDVDVRQTIPAGQEGDAYVIEMVLTATAM